MSVTAPTSPASTKLKGFDDSLSSTVGTTEAIMAAKEISVKRYVVRLSADEREQLEALIRKGKSPAQRLLKARILLKADVSESGEGWSDSRIIKALGDQCVHGLPGAQATGGGRLRGGAESQATRGAGGAAGFLRREGSPTDFLGVFQATPRTRALELAVVGKQNRRTPHP